MPKTEQIDVTRSRETLAELIRRLERSARIVELVKAGRIVARVVPAEASEGKGLREVPKKEQEAAWKRLRKLQRKVGKTMKRRGVTEDDLMRVLLKDD